MRRVLLLAALAAPAAALAQTVSPGSILFTDGTNDLVHGKWISAEECTSTTTQVSLSWSTALSTGTTFPVQAKYTVYASNKQTTDSNCIKADNGTDTKAGPVGATLTATGQTENLKPFPTSAFVAVSGVSCTVAADTPIYVCVQAYQSDGVTAVGLAKGTLTLSTSKPGPPTGVSGTPADDGTLKISWTAPTSDPVPYDYVVSLAADPALDPNPHSRSDIRGTLSTDVSGLVNDVTYTITVVARSEAGNPSDAATGTGTPTAVVDFWDAYQAAGGREQGGCGAGAAGPVALLGVAALLAIFRRRS